MIQSGGGSPTFKSYLTLFVLTLVWGTSFILIKKGLVSFSGMQVGALRIGIAFLVLLPLAVRALYRIPKKYMWAVLAVGIFSSFVPSFLIPLGQVKTDSSTAGILVSMTPMFTYLWGITLFEQDYSHKRTIGVGVGLIGAVSLMIEPGVTVGINSSALYILASTIMYGVSGNIVHRNLKDVDSTDITAVSFFLIGFPALIYLGATDFVEIMQSDPQAWFSLGAVAILAVVGTALALLLFWKLVQQTDPVFGSTTTYLVPIVAILWGIADGETILPHQFVGFALILLSVFLVQKRRK
ncbi:DMT family transporter [Membranicola marinus]|uniref:DMT family transporter n=1 Tax=Membranihabitans marinus TaxID=1227546 RepID=A0A953HL64_9BACT|nr:DMT family transporter [Membranihabitans marinus]MBY5957682.1 DMT family transporter [Membranihabitans marinus]